jgi:hypothetical protein
VDLQDLSSHLTIKHTQSRSTHEISKVYKKMTIIVYQLLFEQHLSISVYLTGLYISNKICSGCKEIMIATTRLLKNKNSLYIFLKNAE